MLMRYAMIIFMLIIPVGLSNAKSVSEFLPKHSNYNPAIAKPSSIIGFEIGQRHIRHDQLRHYFSTLAEQSKRLQLTTIGKTAQWRAQFLVTISSPKNLANLDEILQNRHIPIQHKQAAKAEPLVIWLGYSVHGDEISGANAAMIVAYYLAASVDPDITTMLDETIIVLEPSINPDGMDRFVNWVTTYQGSTNNSDANHIEHHQGWVSGRTNHFWFDLNRDWLLLAQAESRHRLAYYHKYQPHVVGDYHEMAANSSYFFQPGIASRSNPLTPKENLVLTKNLAAYHAKALDQAQRLYYSEESFDDFYYGKGSTYPDINASIGILFEQASARGMQQDTINGLLTFEYGIENHVLTSLSTIEGAWQNREQLKSYRHNFYQQALKQAKKENYKGYIISEGEDKYRLHALLAKLHQHQIKAYPLTENFSYKDKIYPHRDSYFVPLQQPQYRLLQALFNQTTDFPDNTFYDVSGWTMPLAMNINTQAIESTWGLKLANKPWSNEAIAKIMNVASAQNEYAYAFSWQNFLAPKLLQQLLAHNINAKVATKAFASEIKGQLQRFASGTIIVPAALQTRQDWQQVLVDLSNQNQLELSLLQTGLTTQGIDLGSHNFFPLKQPKVLLIGGQGISQYEAGEIRYYLDETLTIPVSVIEHSRLLNINLLDYSHVILVDGNYSVVSDQVATKLKLWVEQGGVIIGQKHGAKWLAEQEVLSADFVSMEEINQLVANDTLRYQDRERLAAKKRIAGAIFSTELDLSHPLTLGYSKPQLPLFRNSILMMQTQQPAFSTVAKYSEQPLLSGYTDPALENCVASKAAIIAHNYGQGRVIASTDVLAFRGYWLGSAKLLANSVFFAKTFNTPIID